MLLYIIRHARTIENEYGIIAGQQDGTLSQTGIEQSVQLADFLSSIPIDIIYASDLGRVKNTIKPFLSNHNVPVYYDPSLRERDQGVLTGKNKDSLHDYYNQEHALMRSNEASVEKIEDMHTRMKKKLETIISDHIDTQNTVLIASHYAFVHFAIDYLYNRYNNQNFDKVYIKNASVFAYQITIDTLQVVLENYVDYLD